MVYGAHESEPGSPACSGDQYCGCPRCEPDPLTDQRNESEVWRDIAIKRTAEVTALRAEVGRLERLVVELRIERDAARAVGFPHVPALEWVLR